MRSLLFLLYRGAKNTLLDILHKPAKLALYLLLIAAVAGMVILSLFTRQEAGEFADIMWLKGILFAYILLFYAISIQKGLSDGDTIFDMNDVNLLFVSPVSPKAILLYGLVRMAKTSFLAGFFILFQSNSLGNGFGIGFDAVLIILLCYVLAMMLLSILSLALYSVTNGNPSRKRIARLAAVAVLLPLAGVFAAQLVHTGNLLTAVEGALRSPVLAWTPVVGWAAESAVSLIAGDVVRGLMFIIVSIAAGGLMLAYVAFSRADYYEDVLVATETAFEKKRAVSEGQMQTEAANGRKVKVAKTGIGGMGASALFYKHLRESLRVNPLGILTWSSIFTALTAWVAAFAMRGDSNLIMILQILMWMQIFLIATGRGLKETFSHYIYLIPEPSFAKIVWSNLEPVVKVLVESVLIFGVAGIIMREAAIIPIGAIVVYTLFSLLLIGINYLSMRVTGAEISAGILMVLYSLAVIVIVLPGLIPALIVGFSIGGTWGTAAGLGILAAWELIAALACFALSKGVLHRCDIVVAVRK